MKIIPAIDIIDGKCVQLVGGKPGTEKFYGDPVETAGKWESMGAELLHVIDLDAALEKGDNLDKVLEIKDSAGIPVQFGGGIRSYEKAVELLSHGIDRVILGTLAVNEYPEFGILNRLAEEFGKDRVIAAIDSKDGKVVFRGWQERTQFLASEFVKNFKPGLIWGFLYTDVGVEGKMRGIEIGGIREVVDAASLPVIVSGGISSIGDIKEIRDAGAWGVVLGKALYEGKINFYYVKDF